MNEHAHDTSAAAEARANALLRAGRTRGAAAAFRTAMALAIAEHPHDGDRLVALRHRLAWSLWESGRSDEAIAVYEEERVPLDHHGCRTLGDLYVETGRLAEALRAYTVVLDWVRRRLAARFAGMAVLAEALATAPGRGLNLLVVDVLRENLHGLGAGYRRRSLGLPMLWSCLADVHRRLGERREEARYREDFLRYWAWYAGREHESVLALARGGGPHA
ncbi:tetratricopeptide repeat protein [Saccharothrix algeriensis]|uniref:Tetratricopeptide (TPR) repeat protein n=2 Tax=Saccharothrix algeriensis TaxID=173560 RepID=A0ABS2S0P8_9PSEU|nr:tetratricopeptide repeat protein [Saccharothrix algeriensis]MBM7809803.1 tetratricopeptide (TPR) repeat protein [Saccharothrix algeriensis]